MQLRDEQLRRHDDRGEWALVAAKGAGPPLEVARRPHAVVRFARGADDHVLRPEQIRVEEGEEPLPN